MEIAGYIASLLIGVSLGLIGGGGSILTVPVLVYLFGISPVLAISYSLFIVGTTSFVGAINNYRRSLVDVRTVFLFGASSVTTVLITRKFVIPLLPNVFFRVGSFEVTQSVFVMVAFAVLMVAASVSMIRSPVEEPTNTAKSKSFLLFIHGVMIGVVTGFLGAGGGFLLIPALVIFVKLPIKKAIGTSLAIIALNSLVGFLGDVGNYAINWIFLSTLASIAVAGSFLGSYLNQRINGAKLKKGFGWFVLVMGIYILLQELLLG